MKSPATLTDVAKAAGVAVGTASRVLNNFTDVSAESRQRVLEAVSRLRYQPLRKHAKEAGRGRGSVQPANIGLVLLGMDDTLLHVPVLTEMLHGIEAAVAQHRGNLLLANLPTADRVPAFLEGRQVEGVILKSSQYGTLADLEPTPLFRQLQRFPLVWTWARPEGAPGDLCSFNHETVARLVAGHLQQRGHRRVAYLTPKRGKSSLEHIGKEFAFACSQRGLELTVLESASPRATASPEPALSHHGELLPLVDQWLALAAGRRPTALFLPADNIVAHLYVALENRGVRVGRDVSVISCNHEKSSVQALQPSLATVDVGAQRIGAQAVEQLLWRLRNPGDDSVRTILFEPTLVDGGSVRTL
jgi:LacI family transcriptional regulator